MRSLIVTLAVLIAACSGSPPVVIDPCKSGALGGKPSEAAVPFNPVKAILGLVDKEIEVDLAQLQPRCPVSNVEVFTEVTDPLNRPVMHTHSDPSQVTTKVKFTPTMPGEYHLSARFEPSLGTAQVSLPVGFDRTMAPSKSFTLDRPCDAFEAMPMGLALCLTAAGLHVFRDGSAVQVIPAKQFAVAGNVVWVIRSGAIERRTEVTTVAGLSTPVILQVNAYDPDTVLIAREDAVLAIGDGQILRIDWDGAALTQTVRTPFAQSGVSASVATPDLKKILNIGHDPNSQGTLKRCVVPIETQPAPECVFLPSQFFTSLGADAMGVWTYGGESLRVDGFDSEGAAFSVASSLWGMKPAMGAIYRFHYESSPAFEEVRDYAISPRLMNGEILLDAVKLEPGLMVMSGSAKTMRAATNAGQQLIITR